MAGFDLLLLCNLSLYYLAAVAGFIIAIPVGINRINFQGVCILYGDFDWKNNTYFVMTGSDPSNCNFPIYFSVFGLIFYGLGMGLYNTYALVKSMKDQTIGSQMWVMPFLLVNGVIAFTTLIVACILSVGFANFCSGFMDGGYKKDSCADGEKITWRNRKSGKIYHAGNYMGYMTVAQIAAWSALLVWLAHIGLGILRFIRNRRLRSRPSEPSTSDTAKIAELEPTA